VSADSPPHALPVRRSAGTARALVRLAAPLIALVLLVLFFSWRTGGRFLSWASFEDILNQAALIVIVGVGVTLVIIAGGIDLSVGAVVAFTGTLAAVLMLKAGLTPLAAAVLATLAGGVIGFFNGFLTVRTRLHPFIITLGAMMIFRGLALALTDARNTDLLPAGFVALASGEFPLGGRRELVIPQILLLYILVIGGAAQLMLSRTRLGRYCFAIGSNAASARLSGIPVDACVTFYFVLAGLLFGWGGVVQAARIGIGQPTVAEGMELEAIAAAVIGGNSLSGGQGSVIGTVLGALLMAALRQGLRMLNLPPYWQTVSLGTAIIAAVVYDRVSRERTR
jgi:ribose/xylose/arabinose/galactoside ABC-type transport system permease subunit